MIATMPLPGGREAVLPRATCDLAGGRTGYFQRRRTDCQRAAVATALQISYAEAPGLVGADGRERTNEELLDRPWFKADELANWEHLAVWSYSRGLRLRFHSKPPAGVWIGFDAADAGGFHHLLVYHGAAVLFDPASGWRFPVGLKLDPPGPIAFGITFDERTDDDSSSG